VHLAVFGGTFDPPHNGHLALCLFARELLDIDRLVISVSNNPLKQNNKAGDVHRKRMAELLSSEINSTGSYCEVSEWELEKRQPSYTVDLLRYFHTCYPNDTLTLLVGEDSFREFSLWKEHEKLFCLCRIVVFRRTSTDESLSPPDILHGKRAVRFIDFSYGVSSTEIRELVAAGTSLAKLVPSSISRYISTHALYRSSFPSTLIQVQKPQES